MKIVVLIIFFISFSVAAKATSSDVPSRLREDLLYTDELPQKLTVGVKKFLEAELLANPAEEGKIQAFHLEHFEIPLDSVTEDRAFNLDPDIYKALVFKKNRTKYLRWVINPEDTKYKVELENYFREQKIPFEKGTYFIGYLTSSRSCIAQDPKSGVTFSVKGSTNQTLGYWKDKKETVRAAKAARLMSDYISRNFKASENQTLRQVVEPLAFYLPGIDQAFTIRQYDHFKKNSSTYLIPAFTATHSIEGKRIAEANVGSALELLDIADYWTKQVGHPVADAIVELLLNFGISYNSPHGQNFLLEMKEDKPTGKIFIRDYADSDLHKEILAARGGFDILDLYSTFKSNFIFEARKSVFSMSLGKTAGPYPKTWLLPSPTPWDKWNDDMDARFKASFSKYFENLSSENDELTLELPKVKAKFHSVAGDNSYAVDLDLPIVRLRNSILLKHSVFQCDYIFR